MGIEESNQIILDDSEAYQGLFAAKNEDSENKRKDLHAKVVQTEQESDAAQEKVTTGKRERNIGE